MSGLIVERTRLDENGKLAGTGEYERMDAQMVLRGVGYQSVPLPGVPFDERSYTVPNEAGPGDWALTVPAAAEYVVGWLKRGPTGVIGTNKSDAAGHRQVPAGRLRPGPEPGQERSTQIVPEHVAGVLAARGSAAGQLRRMAAGRAGRDGAGHGAGTGRAR